MVFTISIFKTIPYISMTLTDNLVVADEVIRFLLSHKIVPKVKIIDDNWFIMVLENDYNRIEPLNPYSYYNPYRTLLESSKGGSNGL